MELNYLFKQAFVLHQSRSYGYAPSSSLALLQNLNFHPYTTHFRIKSIFDHIFLLHSQFCVFESVI